MKIKNPIIELQEGIEKSNGDIKKLQSLFYKTSKDVMKNYFLQINDLKIELKELEFYFFDCEKHPDIYVHQNGIQKNTSNFLYVHDSWGNYGGIDLTFGNGKYYGGILIRGIKLNNKYISGISVVKQYIVDELGIEVESYSALQEYFERIKDKVSLIKKKTPANTEILHSTRFRLGKKEDLKYREALYRFIDLEYMNASPQLFNDSKKYVEEITKVKAISSLSGLFYDKTFDTSKSGKDEIDKINNMQPIMDYIKDFKNN